jgi:hypothetical protein
MIPLQVTWGVSWQHTIMRDTDWNNRPITLGRSVGGVLACQNPWDGLVRGDVTPWPPPELVQKLYQNRQTRAFRDEELSTVTSAHGYLL